MYVSQRRMAGNRQALQQVCGAFQAMHMGKCLLQCPGLVSQARALQERFHGVLQRCSGHGGGIQTDRRPGMLTALRDVFSATAIGDQ